LPELIACDGTMTKDYLCIADYQLPDMVSTTLIAEARQTAGTHDKACRCILLHSCQQLINAEKDDGSIVHLSKPVKNSELNGVFRYWEELEKGGIPSERVAAKEADGQSESGKDFTLLIAEDMEVNMVLVKILIKKVLPQVSILEARDGAEAVSIYQRMGADLILMDVQMPNVDGYAATRQIRKWEAAAGGHVPVVALTASAVAGEKEKCQQAGMDDYLMKPIDQAELATVLHRYASALRQMNAVAAPIAEHALQRFDAQKLLEMVNHDVATRKELLQMTLDQFDGYLGKIQEEIAAGELDKARKNAHAIRGASMSICLEMMVQKAGAVENLPEAQAAAMPDVFAELVAEWEETRKSIQEYL